MTYPAWIDRTPSLRWFVAAFSGCPIAEHRLPVDQQEQNGGRPKGARDSSPRKRRFKKTYTVEKMTDHTKT